jgi:hypothetical protein
MAVVGKHWNGKLVVNSVDMSARVKTCKANLKKSQSDRGVMGSESVAYGHGLEQDTITVQLFADRSIAVGAGDIPVNKTFREMWDDETAVTVVYQAISGGKTAGNPEYTWTSGMSIYDWAEGGTHGQDEMIDVTLIANVVATIAES